MHRSRPRPSASRSRCSFLAEYPFELCRVAREVRIFPLLALDGRTSRHLASKVNDLSDSYEDGALRISTRREPDDARPSSSK
jgi:hypothetical protein